VQDSLDQGPAWRDTAKQVAFVGYLQDAEVEEAAGVVTVVFVGTAERHEDCRLESYVGEIVELGQVATSDFVVRIHMDCPLDLGFRVQSTVRQGHPFGLVLWSLVERLSWETVRLGSADVVLVSKIGHRSYAAEFVATS
jgi:hypothetical protein